MKQHLHRWGVVYFLAAFALAWNAAHSWLEWKCAQYSEDELPWGWEWARSTAENLQSEVWQIAIACLVVDAARRTNFWFRAREEA